ncbi:early nodulin-like protein 3 [Corylus avellana]|uniref:early nodulin-like protein 3 n=1 Tax=Corylus avellana TaxID=13451 RepID=UPI001E1EE67D|nr:early nodulin-like protein 3 [Corylus avellana]
MGSKRVLGVLFVILMGFLSTSQAYKFFVGGKDGWVLDPSESYSHWAERNRFQVNDTLVFKYKKGSDSVLVVTEEHYHACNTTSPTQSLADGDSIFKFGRSGPFFFISSKNCQKGQKLIVVVLAVRNKTHHSPPPSPSPVPESPVLPSPSPSPTEDTPTSAESPKGVSLGSLPPGESPSDFNSPAPAPAPMGKSGASGRAEGSVGLALGVSIGVSAVLSSIVGMV